jgi:ribosomal protein S27AE
MYPQPIQQPVNRKPVTTSHPRIHLTHAVIVKAPGLLPMLYLPAELAGELGMLVRTLYDWVKAGAPHTHDAQGNLWVNGREFASWVEANRKPRSVPEKLKDDQAYCLRCKQAVTLIDPSREQVKGKLVLIKGHCPHCGAGINRGARNDRTSELPAGPRAS